MRKSSPLSLILFHVTLAAALQTHARAGDTAYPPWDGRETVAAYAARINLSPMKTLDLGGGITLEMVLIPAGTFVMGAGQPAPVDSVAFEQRIQTGKVAVGIAACVLILAPAVALLGALRRRRKFQYSLAQLFVLSLVASVGIWGGTHWRRALIERKRATQTYELELSGFYEASDDEKPPRDVTLARPFYMGRTHVTQAQYRQIMGASPSRFTGGDLPVEKITWENAKEFCAKTAERAGLPVRLPTEAEWEFACRAGTKTLYYSGDSEEDLDRAGWYYRNSGKTPHPVGEKMPNAFGLCDMHGNIWQWCQRYNPLMRAEELADTAPDAVRVVRGGSWDDAPKGCRATSVFRYFPDYRPLYIGLRVVVPLPDARIK